MTSSDSNTSDLSRRLAESTDTLARGLAEQTATLSRDLAEKTATLARELAAEAAMIARNLSMQAEARDAVIIQRLDLLRTGQESMALRMRDIEAKADAAATEAKAAHDQASKTNGRVNLLELWQATMNGIATGAGGSWHVFIGGAGLVVGSGGLALAVFTHVVK